MTQDRKDEHIRICLNDNVESTVNDFDKYRLKYNALPEIDINDVDLSLNFLGKKLNYPFLISSMTGGTKLGQVINQNLAYAANKFNIAMAVGSQRLMLGNPEAIDTYKIRDIAPNILLFANLGAVQLNYGVGVAECRELVDSIGADALVLHLNPLQEAIQPEGNTNFADLLLKIRKVSDSLHVPVIVKEVGCGIGVDAAKRLEEVGIKIIDVAGQGGTSFTAVEAIRRGYGYLFNEIGIPTAVCIRDIKKHTEHQIIASGGIRNGLDIAKSLALGADIAGLAKPLLKSASESGEAVANSVQKLAQELRLSMFCMGIQNLSGLNTEILINSHDPDKESDNS